MDRCLEVCHGEKMAMWVVGTELLEGVIVGDLSENAAACLSFCIFCCGPVVFFSFSILPVVDTASSCFFLFFLFFSLFFLFLVYEFEVAPMFTDTVD